MVTVLGVECLAYAPYAFFCYLYPLVIIALGVLFGKKLGWLPQAETAEAEVGIVAGAVQPGRPSDEPAVQNA